jgi:transposase
MFLKRNRRRKNGETYEYWSLVQTVRTAKGPRHRTVCNLGKMPGLDKEHRHGWENLTHLLEGTEPPPSQQGLGSSSTSSHTPEWMQVDVKGLRVERVRDFGEVYLALALWRRLGLHQALEELMPRGREKVAWPLIACVLTVARFCGNKSELEVAERWYQDSALSDLLGLDWEQVYDNRLYRGLDALIEHKDALCQHLLERYQSWFGVDFEFLLYDVTSTYFEGKAEGNVKAKRGYSRDKRSDCKQVNIGLVVTPDGGLPIGYEVFDGNRADVTTVEDMVRLMEEKYGQANRIWVMDRGMVSEDNLDSLRERKAAYIVGTPKGQLRQFEEQLLDQSDWSQVQPGVEVKLVEHPDSRGKEQYVIARSTERAEKESAMLAQAKARLRAKLEQIDAGLRKRPAKLGTIERRIGRWMGKYSRAERFYQVSIRTAEISKPASGSNHKSTVQTMAVGLEITEKEVPLTWAERSAGAYLLRTNCTDKDPNQLWTWYVQLTQAEECFRISKSDLHLRPVFHQKTERVNAHILVCFLTLAMWRSLEMWMKSKGLGNCARQLIKEIATVHMMDVILPVRDQGEMSLRVVSKPDEQVAQLLAHLGLDLPAAPKTISNVVAKNH